MGSRLDGWFGRGALREGVEVGILSGLPPKKGRTTWVCLGAMVVDFRCCGLQPEVDEMCRLNQSRSPAAIVGGLCCACY